ncbi:right-handed parallel beta-helix repeat-containing protein [Ruegeria sp. HKCCD6157]|uniref:right-handed parallel beta-helix repeat-containing protein n=1 Tax=Ruegeria sp. HKCCD6157 TaxID=2690707 RepID=UPI00149142FB|nr:right-handed parallel beta-helix repeat-containing protein [Ruegeria sp. HKCCD6157]NOE28417.1 hypothetical protein [Ruegeria sp. HKCCD6157]
MSTTITVTSAAELNQALSQATGGETILLAAGDYGKLSLNGTQFSSNVTIKSADPSAIASFSAVNLNQASNITFDTILFDYNASSGDPEYLSVFGVYNSSNVTFNNSVFSGDISSGTGSGTGLSIRDSGNIDITNTEFKNWWKAVITANTDGVDIIGNDIHSIRSDGLVFDNVDNFRVEQNYIHDFGGLAGSGDHRDMIQIQRANGSGSDNIIIRDNVFDMGQGDFTQTIWAGGDGKDTSDPNVQHKNVLIEGNVIYNGHLHGISLYGVDGLTIRKNTVLHVDEKTLTGSIEVPVINVSSDSQNVTITQNITSQILGHNGQAGWTVADNVLIKPTEYDQHFTYQATAQTDGYNQYIVKPGSPAALVSAGSDLANSISGSYFDWLKNNGYTGTGTPSQPNTGTSQPNIGTNPPPADTGDNQPETGENQPETGENQPETEGNQPETGENQPETEADVENPINVAEPQGELMIDISNQDSRGNIGKVPGYAEAEEISLSFEMTRGEDDTGAERLVWNHSNFGLKLTKKGHLVAKVDNNDGGFRDGYKIKDLDLNDGEAHQVTMMVDQNTDRLQVLVDGAVVLDETETDFDFAGGGERDWYVGDSVETLGVGDDVDFIDSSPNPYADLFA